MAAQFPVLTVRARVEVIFLAQPEGQSPDGVYVVVEAPLEEERHYQELAIEALRQRIGDSPNPGRSGSPPL